MVVAFGELGKVPHINFLSMRRYAGWSFSEQKQSSIGLSDWRQPYPSVSKNLTFSSVLVPRWSVQMRKLVLVAALVGATAVLSAAIPRAASAWCNGGYGYGCGYAYASPAERFAYSPWGYRSGNSPFYAGWGWRGYGYRSWGWSGRRWGWRRRW